MNAGMEANYSDMPQLVSTPSGDHSLPNLLAQPATTHSRDTQSAPEGSGRSEEPAVAAPATTVGREPPSSSNRDGGSSSSTTTPSNSGALSASGGSEREPDSPSRSLAGLILLRYSNLTAERVEQLITQVRRSMEDSRSDTIRFQNLSRSQTNETASSESNSGVQAPPQQPTDAGTLFSQATTSRGRRVLARSRNSSAESNPNQEQAAPFYRFSSTTFSQNRASSTALFEHLERSYGPSNPRPRPSEEVEGAAFDRLVARLRRSREYALRTPPRDRTVDTEVDPARYVVPPDTEDRLADNAQNRPNLLFDNTGPVRDVAGGRPPIDDLSRYSQITIRRRLNEGGLSIPIPRGDNPSDHQPSSEQDSRSLFLRLRLRGQDASSNQQAGSALDGPSGAERDPFVGTSSTNPSFSGQAVSNSRMRGRGWARVDPNGDDIVTDEDEPSRTQHSDYVPLGTRVPHLFRQAGLTGDNDYWNDKSLDDHPCPWSRPIDVPWTPAHSSRGLLVPERFTPSPLPTKLTDMLPASSCYGPTGEQFQTVRPVPSRSGPLIGR